jgi:tricorn protease
MGPAGYAEFHRDFLSECAFDGLVVDVRFNRGGHVSQLILGQLMQRRLGYSRSRWFVPSPYPSYSVLGPMVALTNEMAGSDGDIFSYHWKALKLGPLVGTRTWGGVVGISPQNRLVDGTIVTQPEFANWFDGGGGFDIENRGVEPDHEVHVAPHDVQEGVDPQLDFALDLLNDRLEQEDPRRPAMLRPSERAEDA